MTLLMWSMVNYSKKSLAYLLEKGANPNYKDAQGTQPVSFVAGLDDIDYLQILLDHEGGPVPHPYYTKPVWLPIRERWYASPEGQSFKAKLDEVGRDPEGFGEKWRVVYRA